MFARPTCAAAVAKDDDLMLARDGTDRVEPAKGATSIVIGLALESGEVDEEIGALIAETNRSFLSVKDNVRLDRTIDERRHAH